jgi:hypothetical protein
VLGGVAISLPRSGYRTQPRSLSDFGAGFVPEGPWESRSRPEGPWEGDFGPKGLGNVAQALAWVALFLRASPRKEHGGSIEEVGSEGAICSGSNWGELITHLTGRGSESI